MKPSSQVQDPDEPSAEESTHDWAVIEIERPLVEAILNTIQNLELEGQYLRLKTLFAERDSRYGKP
jgi:hypothetical protein